MAWNLPVTFTAGMTTAVTTGLNAIRDSLKAIGDPWTAWTPVWTASTTNPVIGNGTITGGVSAAGKMTNVWARIVMGSTTTYGSGNYFLTLPAAQGPGRWTFTGTLRRGTASYPIFAEVTGTSTLTLRALSTTAGNAFINLTSTIPATIANGDEIFISGTYEAA